MSFWFFSVFHQQRLSLSGTYNAKKTENIVGLPQVKTLLQGYMQSVFMISQVTLLQIRTLTTWDMILE